MTRPLTWTPRHPAAVRRTAGALVLLVGLLDMAAVLRPGLYERVELLADLLPGAVVSVSAAASVAVGLLLAALAINLGRGMRRAWRVVVVLLVVELVLQATHAHPLLVAASAVLLVALVVSRDAFVAQSAPLRRTGVVEVGAGLAVACVVLGWLAVTALADQMRLQLSAGQRLLDAVVGFVGISTTVTAPDTRQSDAVYYLLVGMAATTALVVIWLYLRAPRDVVARSADEDDRLRELVSAHADDDSLAYFALRDDRALLWAPNGRACVSYRLVGRTLLAGGDPLGPRSEWPAAIRAFLDEAARLAAVPAVAGCSEAGAQAWVRHGRLTALEFGDEAVLDVAAFTLSGRAMRNVRQAVARAERAGLAVRVRRLADVPAAELVTWAQLVDVWRGTALERGFSMALGRLDQERDPGAVLVTAEVDDRPRALLLLVPWGRDGLSLDLMRRDGQAESGVNELMISRLAAAAPGLGVRRVSLNFAPFREAIERSERFGVGPGTRWWGRLLRLASHGSQADSLYRFNAKFAPEWHRRFLAYPPAVGLPRVTWAYLRAEGMVPSVRRAAVPRPPRPHHEPDGPADASTSPDDSTPHPSAAS